MCEQAAPRRIRAATELDHVIPLSKGGADDDSNLQGLCSDCHRDKTAEDFGHVTRGCDKSGWPLDRHHGWRRGRV